MRKREMMRMTWKRSEREREREWWGLVCVCFAVELCCLRQHRGGPQRGKKAHYLIDGEMVSGLSKKQSGSNSTKSIDFQCDNEYYYAKHTSAEGGGQDNQCDDGKRFIEQANIYATKHNDDKVFILLVDGEYYNDARKNKIRDMISQENKHRVRVCGCDEV